MVSFLDPTLNLYIPTRIAQLRTRRLHLKFTGGFLTINVFLFFRCSTCYIISHGFPGTLIFIVFRIDFEVS